jgi:hypothetical protein
MSARKLSLSRFPIVREAFIYTDASGRFIPREFVAVMLDGELFPIVKSVPMGYCYCRRVRVTVELLPAPRETQGLSPDEAFKQGQQVKEAIARTGNSDSPDENKKPGGAK